MWWSTVGVIVMLTCSLLAVPLPGEAQPTKVPRIGVLLGVAPLEHFQPRFRTALQERGYVEGQNIFVEYRGPAAGQADHLQALAMELVHLQVDLIVALNTPAVQAAKRATTVIPIVMYAGNPVETGLVASLARPGGNVTGLSGVALEIYAKCLELLRELRPAMTTVAALAYTPDPFARPFLEYLQAAAPSVGVRSHPVSIQGDAELDGAFRAMVHAQADAVIIQGVLATPRAAALAVQHHLPAVASSSLFVEAGGLMSYHGTDSYRGIARYVDKILQGAKPMDLPVEQPMKLDLVINLKTAQALGVTIPPSLLLQADKVIK